MTVMEIPCEATHALDVIRQTFCHSLIGVYLYGSAVMGGLRLDSDIDILVIASRALSAELRKDLLKKLMNVSGKVGNVDKIRSLEVTVINHDDVVPWRYPPKREFIYGEWLRSKYEQGYIPESEYDSDLTILLHQAREHSVPLFGCTVKEMLDPVPIGDIRKAMKDSLHSLMSYLKGDERNVLLTLARMWVTASSGDIMTKDAAAEWAIVQLSNEHAKLLDVARRAYLGEYRDDWVCADTETLKLAEYLKKEIETTLSAFNC